MAGLTKIVVSPRREIQEYVLEVIVEFRRGSDRVALIAYGENVCMLADVVARLKDRLGDSLRIVAGDINSRKARGRRESYLYVELEYVPAF